MLADAKDAAIIYVSGRTSTLRPSAADEALALRRALSARSYLAARGVSPLKIMVNFASAADFVADNSTAEGRRENQHVDLASPFLAVLQLSRSHAMRRRF
ncbi:TPA: OmpA family protein [Escherichia coli]